jgi:hypothetical protein
LLSTYPHPEVVVVGAQHGFRIGEENPALKNSFRIPCGRPLIKKNLNFPYANMKWLFFFDNREIQRSLSFHNGKKKKE